MYEVVCCYEDIVFGQMSYVVSTGMTRQDAEILSLTNSEYFVQEVVKCG